MTLCTDTVCGFNILYDGGTKTFVIEKNGKFCRHNFGTLNDIVRLAGSNEAALRWALRDWLMGASIYLLGYEGFCAMYMCDMYNDSVKNSWKRFKHIHNQVKEIIGEGVNAGMLDNLIMEVEKLA